MKNRNPILVSFLSIITIGFYTSYWLYKTSRELRFLGYRLANFSLIAIPALLFSAGYSFLIVVAYINRNVSDAGLAVLVGFLYLYALCTVLFLIFGLYWLVKYCRAVELVTSKELSAKKNLLLFFGAAITSVITGFIWAIWPGYVQHYLNKRAEKA